MLSFSHYVFKESNLFILLVIIFFKNLLLFRSARSIPVFRSKSLGLNRHYLRISQR